MSGLGPAYPGGAPHSRGRYTETSEAAAKGVEPRLNELQRRVLDALRAAGDEGRTADELAEQLHEWLYSIAPRCRELDLLGWIEATTRTRPTPRGRQSIVWRALAQRREQVFERKPFRRRDQLEQRVAELERRDEEREREIAELRRAVGGTQRRLL